MKILSNIYATGAQGYHGTIGAMTNMYDSVGNVLFVGDVVSIINTNIDGTYEYNHGINFVCEENTQIANFTGRNQQFIMGISSVFNSIRFSSILGDHCMENLTDLYEKMEQLQTDKDVVWRVYKVKSHEKLVVGENIESLVVREIGC